MSQASTAESIIQLVSRFNDAVNARDIDSMMALMTDDCVFENTFPLPDGTRYIGQTAVCKFWNEFFRTSRNPHFETEEIFATGDRCVVRWIYRWTNPAGEREHIRGIDVFTIREGSIVAKLSYVKG